MIIGLLAPNRRHAITWTNVYPLHWRTHICGTQGEMPAFCTKSWKYLECSHFFPRVYEEARKWVKSSKFGNTSKIYRAPLLYYIKLWASSQTHRWIQTGVTVPKRSIQVKISDFLPHVSLKFDGWPWKTIGCLFYVTLSFVHHFKAIGESKLKLQSGNAQFGSKSAIFCPMWPWNLTDGQNNWGTSPMLLLALCIIS